MSDDNLEGPEVDLLIRELAHRRKPAAPKPAVSQPSATAPGPTVPPAARPTGSLEKAAPAGRQKKFVSAISVESLPSFQSSSSFRSLRPFRSFASFPSFPSFASFPSFLSFPSFRSFPSLLDMSSLIMPGQVAVVRMHVGLAVLLGSAMPYWPYPKDGTWWLLFYMFAVAMVLVAGVWSARLTWVTRLGVAHVVALGVVLWGITLAAEETLRSGYVPPDAMRFP